MAPDESWNVNSSDLVLCETYGSLEIHLDLRSFCLRTRETLKMPAMKWMGNMFAERKFAWKWLVVRPEVDEHRD